MVSVDVLRNEPEDFEMWYDVFGTCTQKENISALSSSPLGSLVLISSIFYIILSSPWCVLILFWTLCSMFTGTEAIICISTDWDKFDPNQRIQGTCFFLIGIM